MYLHAVLEGAPDLSGALWNVSALLQTDGGALQAEAVPRAQARCASCRRLLRPWRNPFPHHIPAIALSAKSSAAAGRAGKPRFVLETGTGDWGQTVYTARETRVASGETDGTRIAILDGLHPGDRIIVSSTEAITDGQIVLPQGFALP